VYIVAYLGRVVYVGKASQNVDQRLVNHLYRRGTEPFGAWMAKVQADWENVRLDVLEPPDDGNTAYWLKSAEAALIRKLRPLFNQQIQD
jgi:hypothetical protein